MKKASAQNPLENPDALDAHLEDITRRLDRLRGLYEAFFMGIERTPPAVPRRELNRILVEMQQVTIKNSTQRFRYNALSQRWVLMTAYWNRTLREIESGTYRRDIEKAQRRMAAKGGELSEQEAIALGIPAGRVKVFLGRQQKLRAIRDAKTGAVSGAAADVAAAAVPVARSPGPPAALAAVPGLSDAEVGEFFRSYVDAHKQIGVEAPKVTLEQMKQRLAREVPKIMAQKNCSKIKLQIVVEDGKVRLGAKPVRG